MKSNFHKIDDSFLQQLSSDISPECKDDIQYYSALFTCLIFQVMHY